MGGRVWREAIVLDAARPALIDGAAELLAAQWPQQGAASRRAAILSHCASRAHQRSALPCHLVLAGDADSVLAHCRLQAACDDADGFSAALTSVVVRAELRGTGVGRKLLVEAEALAAAHGFAYLYLWTHEAQGFYAKCGYAECEKVSLLKPALSKVGGEGVRKLEHMLARRCAAAAASGVSQVAAEAVVREDSVWMRKRLLERVEAAGGRDSWMERVRVALAARRGEAEARVWLAAFEWERQCGPCCGLAALRMARSCTSPPREEGAAEAEEEEGVDSRRVAALCEASGLELELLLERGAPEDAAASLLQAAISRGYSSDGELFDIHHLAELAADVCGLGAAVVLDQRATDEAEGGARRSTGALWREAVPLWLRRGGLVVVPYDKDELHHQPTCRGGHGAHYALLIGLASDAAGEVLLGAHGLSRQPLVMTPAELHESNAQLLQMKRTANSNAWVVGKAGIRLADRALFLWPQS
ncbi:hypothetical protein AB1Y20_021087 [Prymnesium parvum]|uniref:N-acetyltransferase domain-containing protein n=1 Tax=Prymnesium parvum TaxID=97485 RepID=A0AB34JKB9_PRYPA